MAEDARGQGIPARGAALVGIGLAASQVIAMLQMLVVSRILGPVEFGAFGALAVILLVGSTTMAATQVVIARHVASGRSAQHVGGAAVSVVGIAACLVTVAVAPFVTAVLNLSSVLGVMLVGASFIPMTLTGAQLGLLQGAERHVRLGALYVTATATRVGGAIAGAAIGTTAVATMLGVALGATMGALAGHFLIVGQPSWGGREEGARELVVEVGHAAHALIALYALTNIDVLLARAQLGAHDAGLYAAGALIARAVFFLPQAILVAAFPRMVAGSRTAQRQAVLAVAGLGLLAVAAVAALPRLVVLIMAGGEYLPVAGQAWLFALAGAGFGVVQVLLYARMANQDRRATILLWLGVATLAGLGLTVGTSIPALATCAVTVAWATALAGLVWAWTGTAPGPRGSRGRQRAIGA